MINIKTFMHHPAARAVGIIFALCGLIFGTWASFIPYVREKFHLDEAQLGLLLLCLPIGTFIANPLSVFIIAHWGKVKTSLLSIIVMGIAFSLPVIVSNIVMVIIGLVFAGASFACTNVAMNTCASDLEEESGLRIMSTCHGMWSLGAMAGGLLSGFAIVTLKAHLNSSWNAHAIYSGGIGLAVIFIMWFIKDDLREIHEDWAKNKKPERPGIGMFKPNKILWILISIILCTYLTEGSIADWSGVYMRDISKAPETIVGWGFGLYALFMAGGRFLGDELIAKYGNINVLRMGGMLVTLGLVVIIISTSPWMALPGFMLTGLGISVASPILYAAAARVPDMPPGVGLATLNTFGMVAFLGGPVIIGGIAKIYDLRIAYMLVAIAAMVWVVQTVVISQKKIAP